MKQDLMKTVNAENEETNATAKKKLRLKWKLIFSHVEWLRLRNKMIFYCARFFRCATSVTSPTFYAPVTELPCKSLFVVNFRFN